MSHYQIAVVVGSLRQDSFNRKLADAIVEAGAAGFLFPASADQRFAVIQSGWWCPSGWSCKAIEKRDKKCPRFVTAEYNRSIPGVLKTPSITPRPYGQNVWAGKPAGVIGISIGVIGTAICPSSICETFWLFWICRRWGSRKYFFRQRMDCLMETGHIGAGSKQFCRTGWINMLPGWKHATWWSRVWTARQALVPDFCSKPCGYYILAPAGSFPFPACRIG